MLSDGTTHVYACTYMLENYVNTAHDAFLKLLKVIAECIGSCVAATRQQQRAASNSNST